MIPIIGLVITIVALIVSVTFNILQLRSRRQEHAERLAMELEIQRKEEEGKAEQRRREQSPPTFYSVRGNPGPIAINRIQHSVQGPFMDMWGLVTVVNPTERPMKISPVRMVLAGEEWPTQMFFFRLGSNPRERYERISIRGNDKEDYELHLMFPDNKYPTPPSREGQIWFVSDNRLEEFAVEVTCP